MVGRLIEIFEGHCFIPTLIFSRFLISVAELLNFYKFPGDEIPIIRGSALSALQGTNEEIGKKAILKLMDAVDEYIPEPVRQLDKPFLMPIEDVFSIQVNLSCVLATACAKHQFRMNCLSLRRISSIILCLEIWDINLTVVSFELAVFFPLTCRLI